MNISIFDIEANGLYPDKIHCLSKYEKGRLLSTTDYGRMRSFLTRSEVLVGHNITRWDIPHLERLLDIKIEAKLVDTLALSWYLEPNKVMHGLEWWGEEFGIEKPKIDDWEGLTTEEYVHRCEEDVKINTQLWERFWKHLLKLYGSEGEAWRLVDYLMFKMDCAREQERSGWKLDVDKCVETLDRLSKEKSEKIDTLTRVMPKVPVKAKSIRPKKPFKKDGSRSATGEKWFKLLEDCNLPEDYEGEVEWVRGYKEPNPNSHQQIKDWLYSLGWKPTTFKYVRDKDTGDIRKIEQINKQHEVGVCDSVSNLFDVAPDLVLLDGLSVLSHRISILKGFLESENETGWIQAQIQGLTNTLRFKHKTVVNLPGVDKPYGEDIRGCLIAPEGSVLCGSDMCSLEDRTKQHYMWDYDPEYVKEMLSDDFDPHVDLAVTAKMMTAKQAEDYKNGDHQYRDIRHNAKQGNYACTYGAGGATVARTAGISVREGEKLVEAYWKRNWAVRAIADDCIVKTCNKQKWLYNPVSKFWYSLRTDKDRFSTLNQGTGVYCFDMWIENFRKKRSQLTGQMHDEVILCIKEGSEEKARKLLKEAIKETNEQLKLNRELDVDIQFGKSYSEIH